MAYANQLFLRPFCRELSSKLFTCGNRECVPTLTKVFLNTRALDLLKTYEIKWLKLGARYNLESRLLMSLFLSFLKYRQNLEQPGLSICSIKKQLLKSVTKILHLKRLNVKFFQKLTYKINDLIFQSGDMNREL